MMNRLKSSSPWLWVPTLYFAEGIPYFVVNNISVMMFTKMGVPNGDMSFSPHCSISVVSERNLEPHRGCGEDQTVVDHHHADADNADAGAAHLHLPHPAAVVIQSGETHILDVPVSPSSCLSLQPSHPPPTTLPPTDITCSPIA